MGNKEKAFENFQILLKLEIDDLEALIQIGNIFIDMKKFQEASNIFFFINFLIIKNS